MSMKIGVGVAAAIFAATVCAETFKGAVSVSLYPSVEELAQAYAKSEDADWRKVAADLIASRIFCLCSVPNASRVIVSFTAAFLSVLTN